MSAAPAHVLAAHWRRAVASLIDLVIVPAVTLLLVLILGTVEDAEDYQDSFWVAEIPIITIAVYIGLNGLLLRRRGQTIGKALMKIRIVDAATGENTPLWKLLVLRAPFFPLPVLLPLWPLSLVPLADLAPIAVKSRRCLHDFVAGTVVVDAAPPS